MLISSKKSLLQKQFMVSLFLISFVKIMIRYDLKFIKVTHHIKKYLIGNVNFRFKVSFAEK